MITVDGHGHSNISAFIYIYILYIIPIKLTDMICKYCGKQYMCIHNYILCFLFVCVHVCVCVSERERERERES